MGVIYDSKHFRLLLVVCIILGDSILVSENQSPGLESTIHEQAHYICQINNIGRKFKHKLWLVREVDIIHHLIRKRYAVKWWIVLVVFLMFCSVGDREWCPGSGITIYQTIVYFGFAAAIQRTSVNVALLSTDLHCWARKPVLTNKAWSVSLPIVH